MSEQLSGDRALFERLLAAYGLRVPAEEIPGLQAAVAEIEEASHALRRPRPYQLEPTSAFRLIREVKP